MLFSAISGDDWTTFWSGELLGGGMFTIVI